jgi:hypothetical protein
MNQQDKDKLKAVAAALVGRKIVAVDSTDISNGEDYADEGLCLTLDDKTKLWFGYSGCEGTTKINGKEVEVDWSNRSGA